MTNIYWDTHNDGPTLLKLIFLEVNPATKVSLQHHNNIISSAKLGGFGNFLTTMLNAMENAYDKIISNQGSHDDYMIFTFSILLSSKTQFSRIIFKYSKTGGRIMKI